MKPNYNYKIVSVVFEKDKIGFNFNKWKVGFVFPLGWFKIKTNILLFVF